LVARRGEHNILSGWFAITLDTRHSTPNRHLLIPGLTVLYFESSIFGRLRRKTVKTTLKAIALAFALTGPAIAADDAMSGANQINQKWVAASDKRDAAAWAALYIKGGSVLPQGAAEPVIGEANIRKFFDGMTAGPKPENFKITVSEATMLDPKIILANGSYALDFPGQNGGASTHVTGMYLAIDVLDGSTWKIRSNTWNEMPPPSK
jgi:ketosteroid isomerase-like protein